MSFYRAAFAIDAFMMLATATAITLGLMQRRGRSGAAGNRFPDRRQDRLCSEAPPVSRDLRHPPTVAVVRSEAGTPAPPGCLACDGTAPLR